MHSPPLLRLPIARTARGEVGQTVGITGAEEGANQSSRVVWGIGTLVTCRRYQIGTFQRGAVE